jgi:hypothetical protein
MRRIYSTEYHRPSTCEVCDSNLDLATIQPILVSSVLQGSTTTGHSNFLCPPFQFNVHATLIWRYLFTLFYLYFIDTLRNYTIQRRMKGTKKVNFTVILLLFAHPVTSSLLTWIWLVTQCAYIQTHYPQMYLNLRQHSNHLRPFLYNALAPK